MIIRILDLDNCIADDGWRVPMIDHSLPDPWSVYHAGIIKDAYKNRLLVENAVARGLVLFIVTARPVAYRRVTENWLNSYRIPFHRLWMRPNDNIKPSVEFKTDLVRKMKELWRMSIVDAYDDTPAIVEGYKSLGIDAYEARIHNIPYPQPPEES